MLPTLLKETLFIRAFGLARVPVIAFLGPNVIDISDRRAVIEIPLDWRSRNHLRSMYFGALCVGADLAGGIMALRLARACGVKLSFVFKDMRANFLKRAEGDVHFTCEDGDLIAQALARTQATGDRQNCGVFVRATVPGKNPDESVAEFWMTLSLKRQA